MKINVDHLLLMTLQKMHHPFSTANYALIWAYGRISSIHMFYGRMRRALLFVVFPQYFNLFNKMLIMIITMQNIAILCYIDPFPNIYLLKDMF